MSKGRERVWDHRRQCGITARQAIVGLGSPRPDSHSCHPSLSVPVYTTKNQCSDRRNNFAVTVAFVIRAHSGDYRGRCGQRASFALPRAFLERQAGSNTYCNRSGDPPHVGRDHSQRVGGSEVGESTGGREDLWHRV